MMRKYDHYKKGNGIKTVFTGIIALCLVIAICVSCLAGCSSCTGDEATPDESVVETTINKDSYVFANGITVGEIKLDGLTYNQALELINSDCISKLGEFTLTVKALDKSFEYGKDDFDWKTDAEAVLNDAVNYSEQLFAKNDSSASDVKAFTVSLSADADSVSEVAKSVAKDIDLDPENASITSTNGGKVQITKEKSGYKLDTDDLEKQLASVLADFLKGTKNTAEITARVDEVKPEVTYNDLDGNITLLSTFSTYSTNTADGDHNMATALEACNGSVIQPGEVWSFNACTGDSNLTSNGYRAAAVIIGGKIEQGIGGGICQASTTIYNAAIRANLEIVERSCHYFQSSYADAGLDATIDYPNLDLRLRNTTQYPIYIQCYMSNATLYCSIYGWQDPSYDTIEVESYTYDANRAANYYRAAACRIFYKNGVEVKREDLPGSTYHYTSPTEPTKPKTTKPATKPTTPATKPVTQAPTEAPVTTKPITTPPTDTPVITDPVEVPTTEIVNY